MRLLLFAAARETAGGSSFDRQAATLGDLLAQASADFGRDFAAVLGTARVWVNGDEPESGGATPLRDGDEIAVLPPVSGGS